MFRVDYNKCPLYIDYNWMSRVYSCIKCCVWWCIYVQVFTNKCSVLFCSKNGNFLRHRHLHLFSVKTQEMTVLNTLHAVIFPRRWVWHSSRWRYIQLAKGRYDVFVSKTCKFVKTLTTWEWRVTSISLVICGCMSL